MGSYKLLIKPSAAKELEDIAQKGRLRLAKKIRELAKQPRPPSVEKLSAHDLYRIRHGDYRILYEIADRDLTLTVIKVRKSRGFTDDVTLNCVVRDPGVKGKYLEVIGLAAIRVVLSRPRSELMSDEYIVWAAKKLVVSAARALKGLCY